MTLGGRKITYWINVLISLFFMFAFGLIPPAFGLTELGMKLIGILLGAVYGWMTIEIAWPSLAGLLAISVCGYDSLNNVLKNAFGNSTVVMMLFIVVFTMYMNRCGCMDAITNWFISRKIIVGRPYVTLCIFFVLSTILSVATSNIAAMLFLFSIAVSFCQQLGYQKGDRYPIALFFVIYIGTQFGLAVIPIKPVTLMTIALIETAANITVNRLYWTLFATVLYAFVVFPIWLLTVRFLIRPETAPFRNMSGESFSANRNVKIPWEAKIGFAAIILMVFVTFAPTFLPSGWAITKFCSKAGISGAVILVFVLISILPKAGKAKFNFHEIANSGPVSWNLILMTAFALTIAGAISSDASGFNAAVTTNLAPIMGAFNPAVMMIVFCTILHLLTNVLSNGAMSAVFINPTAVLAAALGMDPFCAIALAIYAMGDGLLTPAGTAAAPLLMGHEWMDMKQYYKHAAAIFLAFQVFIVLASVILF